MKNEQELKFDNILKEREKLSKMNNKKNTVSKDDAQLIDLLENFNETDEYKEMHSND